MVGVPTAACGATPSAGPSSSGTGTAPVATAWATTMIPPSAPTVSTAAVAAVVVQSAAGARLTSASAEGHLSSRKYDSPRAASDGDIIGEDGEDTDPPYTDEQFKRTHGPTR